MIGGQPGINALSATFYPTYLRSTGVGAGLGVGRTGAIIGPYMGGDAAGAAVDAAAAVLRGRLPALVTTLTIIALSFIVKLPDHAAQAPALGAADQSVRLAGDACRCEELTQVGASALSRVGAIAASFVGASADLTRVGAIFTSRVGAIT